MNNKYPEKSRVEEHESEYGKSPSTGKTVLRWLLSIIGILVLVGACYAGYVYFRTRSAINKTYDQNNAVQVGKGEFNGKNKFAVLLMGTDTGALDRHEIRGNTDTMILAIVNPSEKKYTLMSIPRDTMAQIEGTKEFKVAKINSAYPIGGAKTAMNTVSALLNVPIKYYAVINMGGLTRMVNGVGGVEVKPPLSFTFAGYSFTKGKETHLTGAKALAYSRMRYDDPNGDYGRQQRQRQVIVSLVQHAAGIKTLVNLESILNSMSKNIRTNIPFNSLVSIVRNYRTCAQNSTSDYLHGSNATIDQAAYQVISTRELQRASDLVRNQLGLTTQTIENNETYQNTRNAKAGFKFNKVQAQDYKIYNYQPDNDDDLGSDN